MLWCLSAAFYIIQQQVLLRSRLCTVRGSKIMMVSKTRQGVCPCKLLYGKGDAEMIIKK